MTAFWYVIIAVGTLAAVINFSIGWAHRERSMPALVRFAAGAVSLLTAVGVVVTKVALHMHLPAAIEGPDANKYVFIVAGLFIGATLMLPAYVERSGGTTEGVTMQQRAARPANATVRLQKNTDEWVN
ncbi:MAG: hypothetical protein PVSMB4_13090 [Ktedonobacterales bacterium]